MKIEQLLEFAVSNHAADLYIQTGTAPMVRIGGQVRAIESPPLTDEQVREMIRTISPRAAVDNLESTLARGFDFSYALGNAARFRCNLYSHLGTPGLVIRVVPLRPRTFEELNLPSVLSTIANARRGLTLMSGTTGSGKSSTLAAIVDLLNSNCAIKILTIEDPVEFVHASKQALISHVEVGGDTPSFVHGMRQAMRQAPDVILIGELRDAETAQMALRAADTGHQVLSTVHGSNAVQTIERFLAMVPFDELTLARQQLSASLVAVISQRLAISTKGMLWPVVEVLRGDAVTAKLILESKIGELAEYVATGQNLMQTFDKHILELFHQGILSEAEALRVATNPEAVSFGIRVAGANQPPSES